MISAAWSNMYSDTMERTIASVLQKKGIGVASYGKYAQWCHVGSTDNNLETMLFATELILHWKEIKSRIIAKREESLLTEEYLKNFTV